MASRQTRKKLPLVFAPEGTVRTFDPRNEVATHENAPIAIATENFHTRRPVPPQPNPGLRPNRPWNANASKNYVPVVRNNFQRQGVKYTPEMASYFADNSKEATLSSTLRPLLEDDMKLNQALHNLMYENMVLYGIPYDTAMDSHVEYVYTNMSQEEFDKFIIESMNKAVSTHRILALRNKGLGDLADYLERLYKRMRDSYEGNKVVVKERWDRVGSVNSNRRMANQEATRAALLRERELEAEREIRRGREVDVRREMNRQAAERRIENSEKKRHQIMENAKESLARGEEKSSTWNIMKYFPRMWGGATRNAIKAIKTRKNR